MFFTLFYIFSLREKSLSIFFFSGHSVRFQVHFNQTLYNPLDVQPNAMCVCVCTCVRACVCVGSLRDGRA